MNRTRQIKRFKTKSERLLAEIRETIESEMPIKGECESECQRLALINLCDTFQQKINAIEKDDFIENKGEHLSP
jgi:hypothetical protein